MRFMQEVYCPRRADSLLRDAILHTTLAKKNPSV